MTNETLRRTIVGVAVESRHILGKAADVYFPDVPANLLRLWALAEQRGGVGYYPLSAPPFVHVDTDAVRSWPRMPRSLLALLFPSGQTLHSADDGGSISPDDVKMAREQYPALALQADQFHAFRRARLGGLVATTGGILRRRTPPLAKTARPPVPPSPVPAGRPLPWRP